MHFESLFLALLFYHKFNKNVQNHYFRFYEIWGCHDVLDN